MTTTTTGPQPASRNPSETDAAARAAPDIRHVPYESPFQVRDLNSSFLSEIWLVSAVVTILGIRIYLAATGYPQVGGAKLHVAHMLWGGLGMTVAVGLLLIFASEVWKVPAAVIGGAGFGCFIDELGKFITKDNDYFYRPTIALIYAVLVILFLIARSVDRFDKVTPSDHLFYAVQGLQSLVVGHMDATRQQAALQHLADSGERGPLADAIRGMLDHADLVDRRSESSIMRMRNLLISRYWRLVSGPWLRRIVIGIFVVQSITALTSLGVAISQGTFSIANGISFSEWGTLLSGFAAGLAAGYGLVLLWRNNRRRGLEALLISTQIALLFGQFFAFASDQFAALGSLVLQLVILGVLRFWIAADRAGSPSQPMPRVPDPQEIASSDSRTPGPENRR